jgi:hypothetical protein
MPPNRIGTLTLPATKNGGLRGGSLCKNAIKKGICDGPDTLPATKTRGLREAKEGEKAGKL